MQDVNARIIVAVESAKAEQQTRRVKNSIKGITDARMKDLQVARAKTKAELAEYKSMIAAQKAYAAEQQLAGAEAIKRVRQRRGADKEELELRTRRIEQYRGEVLKLQDAESAANLQAYKAKQGYDQLASGVSNTGKAVGNLTRATKGAAGRMAFFRSIGKLLKADVGTGLNPELVKAGIYAAGFAVAVKGVVEAVRLTTFSMREEIALQTANSASHREATQALRERHEAQKDALSIVAEYHEKEELTATETLKLSRAMQLLGDSFEQLGAKIDPATGKLINFYEIQGKLSRKQIEEEKKRIKSELKQLAADEKSQRTYRDSGMTFFTNFITRNVDDYKKTAESMNKTVERRMELMKRMAELRRMNPEADAEAARIDAEARKQKKAAEEMKRKQEEERRAAAERAKAERQYFSELSSQMNQYRSTMQTAVFANSAEGLRLQSRMMLNTDTSPAQKTADGVKTLVNQGQQIMLKLNDLSYKLTAGNSNTNKLATAISGGRTY